MNQNYWNVFSCYYPNFQLPMINMNYHIPHFLMNQPEKNIEKSSENSVISQVKEQEIENLNIQNAIPKKKQWSHQEDQLLCKMVQNENLDWKQISERLEGRTDSMCYSRYRRLLMKPKNYYWKDEDNELIIELVNRFGFKWKQMNKYLPTRTPKQIREHYLNFLRPNINKSQWTSEQDVKLCKLVKSDGNKWKSFENYLPGRTENQIKSRYYGKLKKIIEKKIKIP